MTVICKVGNCPFRTKGGFCKSELVSVTAHGQCGWIFDKNGIVKAGWDKKPEYQEKTDEEWMGYTE